MNSKKSNAIGFSIGFTVAAGMNVICNVLITRLTGEPPSLMSGHFLFKAISVFLVGFASGMGFGYFRDNEKPSPPASTFLPFLVVLINFPTAFTGATYPVIASVFILSAFGYVSGGSLGSYLSTKGTRAGA